MSTQESNGRLSLRDIVRASADDFNELWNSTKATNGFDPLPPGVYRCLTSDSRLFTSKAKATPGFKLVFEVLDGPHAGPKVWHDIWLTRKALSMAKGELARL